MPELNLQQYIETLIEMESSIKFAEHTMKEFSTATEFMVNQNNAERLKRYKEALQFAISKLQLLLQVEENGVKKREIKQIDEKNTCFGHKERTGIWVTNGICNDCGLPVGKNLRNPYDAGFNSAIDLCQAEWVKKLEGVEEVIPISAVVLDTSINGCPCWVVDKIRISQAIITYLTEGR